MLSGLTTPTGIAFLGPNDFFVIEKNTGKVKRVRNGMVTEVLDPATASHIHRGVAGVAGPVVVTLTPPTSAESQGCVAADPALIRDVRDNPGNYYVNVHNAAFPAGAVRGQLMR